MIKERDGNVLTAAADMIIRWKEYFEKLMNGKMRENKVAEVKVVDQEEVGL